MGTAERLAGSLAGLGGTGGEDFSIASQVWIQFQAVMVTVVWCGVLSFVFLYIVKFTIGLRVEPDAEREGLDLAEHGEVAYHQ